MVAGHAVQRLGNVSCSLQDDLLGREGECPFCLQLPRPPGGRRPPPPCPTRPNDSGVPPSLGPDGDKTDFVMGEEPPLGRQRNGASEQAICSVLHPQPKGPRGVHGSGGGVEGPAPRVKEAGPQLEHLQVCSPETSRRDEDGLWVPVLPSQVRLRRTVYHRIHQPDFQVVLLPVTSSPAFAS